jgi:hypothetical protein
VQSSHRFRKGQSSYTRDDPMYPAHPRVEGIWFWLSYGAQPSNLPRRLRSTQCTQHTRVSRGLGNWFSQPSAPSSNVPWRLRWIRFYCGHRHQSGCGSPPPRFWPTVPPESRCGRGFATRDFGWGLTVTATRQGSGRCCQNALAVVASGCRKIFAIAARLECGHPRKNGMRPSLGARFDFLEVP